MVGRHALISPPDEAFHPLAINEGMIVTAVGSSAVGILIMSFTEALHFCRSYLVFSIISMTMVRKHGFTRLCISSDCKPHSVFR